MSSLSTRKAIAAIALVLGLQPLYADSRTLTWDQLPRILASQSASIELDTGARVDGRIVSIDSQGLLIEVRKTTDSRLYPRGQDSLPRERIATILWRHSTKRWRIVGTIVGAGAGVPAGVLVAIEKDGLFGPSRGGTPLGILTIAGVTAAGYFIGWAADRHKTTIIVQKTAIAPTVK